MAEKIIKTAVIGAGAAGLTATKCLTDLNSGFECTTFELSNSVGGTWVYTEDVGQDKYGLPVHSSMYQGLSTNLPKQIMSLPGLPFQSNSEASFVPSAEVLQYFNEYADHFNLRQYIKLEHHVNLIKPIENGRWEVSVTNLVEQKDIVDDFDAVIICSGNYSNPVIPRLPNHEKFKGIQFHSHDYKHPSRLQGMTALVIGAGASAIDVTLQGSKWASKLYLSHHKKEFYEIDFPSNVVQKPDVRELTENGVIFTDGSEVQVDAIAYCTGYEHKYPFLHPSCGISVNEGVVTPTYKHFVNIEHPTMFFVGVPRDCPAFTMFHMQVQCCVKILKGESKLPSKEEMYAEFNEDLERKRKTTGSVRGYHRLKEMTEPYFDSLSELANLPKASRMVCEIYFSCLKYMLRDIYNFRKRIYDISMDEERYTITTPSA